MRIDLGWFYIYIGRDGIHIEIENYPQVWITLSFLTQLDIDREIT
jgi:hypothetical protein